MKKALSLITTAPMLLMSAGMSFAQSPIDTCPDGKFSALCGKSTDSISTILPNIIQIVFVVAVLIALAFLIFGGVRWILSGGEKEKVGEARNMIVAAIVGLVVVFLAYFILNIVLGLFGLSLNDLTLPHLLTP